MLSAINHSLGSFHYQPLQQDAAEPQRRKRSIDDTQMNVADPNSTGNTNNNRSKPRGQLTGLGGGQLL
ncbi:hypothetical protein SAMN04490182_4372 [Pseudomonas cedrina]|uniref:Uncharacterized protein n=2 Tax=Pseudomonas cedrina TaxID=651740 RepID=A0A1V2KJ98_PSECE|nr:hypothetical protein BLL36_02620 [Pseudomonas cedrina subsp. cedrina]SDT38064.1 hypothetical protein SAMN04490182_4372 [Pseudomonas cedrina]